MNQAVESEFHMKLLIITYPNVKGTSMEKAVFPPMPLLSKGNRGG